MFRITFTDGISENLFYFLTDAVYDFIDTITSLGFIVKEVI